MTTRKIIDIGRKGRCSISWCNGNENTLKSDHVTSALHLVCMVCTDTDTAAHESCELKRDLKRVRNERINIYLCVRITHTRHVFIHNLRPGTHTQCIFHPYTVDSTWYSNAIHSAVCTVHRPNVCGSLFLTVSVNEHAICVQSSTYRFVPQRSIVIFLISSALSSFFNFMTTCCEFVTIHYHYCCCWQYSVPITSYLVVSTQHFIELIWVASYMHGCKIFCTMKISWMIATTKYTQPPIIQI